MSDAIVRIMCPNLRCRAVLAVPNEARGRLVRCRNCGSNIRVPQKVVAPAVPDGDGADGDSVETSQNKPNAA